VDRDIDAFSGSHGLAEGPAETYSGTMASWEPDVVGDGSYCFVVQQLLLIATGLDSWRDIEACRRTSCVLGYGCLEVVERMECDWYLRESQLGGHFPDEDVVSWSADQWTLARTLIRKVLGSYILWRRCFHQSDSVGSVVASAGSAAVAVVAAAPVLTLHHVGL
jgi:hypothetical protein